MAQANPTGAPGRPGGAFPDRPTAGFPPQRSRTRKAIACELPARLGLPLSRLYAPDIRAEVLARGLVAPISDTTIWRWLDEDAITPWTQRKLDLPA